MLLSNTSCYYQTPHVISNKSVLLSNSLWYYEHRNLLPLHFISYYYSYVQSSIIVAQQVEHSLSTRQGPGSSLGQGKTFLAFFGVFKDGDLEYDNRFLAAHMALHEKVFLGKKLYLNQKLYFLK